MSSSLPGSESERLKALQSYQILDTPAEKDFDDLAALAAGVCGTPIAMVSLIDEARQWFKAKVGLDVEQTPREIAFCSYTIEQSDVLEIQDTLADSRFSQNPLVVGDPHIRFYAGAPLMTPAGSALGTLCVVDLVPRKLSDEQKDALIALSRQTVSQLELRRVQFESKKTEEALRTSEEFKTRIIECSQDCIKVLDLDGRLLTMNAGGMKVLEIVDFEPLRSCPWVEFWQGEYRNSAEAAIEKARKGEVGRFVGFCPTWQGKPRWWDVMVSAILDADGKPEKLLAVSRDTTERKRSEQVFRAITEATAAVTADDFFRSLVKHVAAAMNGRYVFLAECPEEHKGLAITLSYWKSDDFVENVSYDLNGTPCKGVVAGNVCYYPDQLQSLFPEDKPLVDMEAVSYLGVPVQDLTGKVLGHLVVMDSRPMAVAQEDISVLRTFASRAAAEIQRMRAEKALRAALIQVEELKNRLQAEVIYLQEEIRTQHNFEDIVGSSPAIRKIFESIEKVSKTDTTVLITGETGTGKELAARAIHKLSSRSSNALIAVNCAALPSGLIESELFGHEKGAFTGAIQRTKGKFELADSGTIFLDEVGELPLETQAKLMRVLQEHEFERVGGSQTIRADVRVIAATNRELEALVRKGAFRADLFYRLHIFPIHLPPLRDRREDIPLLASHFIAIFCRKMGKKISGISPRALEILQNYSWPGNVRELANVLERGVILCDEGVLQAEHIAMLHEAAAAVSQAEVPTLADSERNHILKTLEKTNWVVGGPAGAARLLNINRTTLIARMKKLGIQKPAGKF